MESVSELGSGPILELEYLREWKGVIVVNFENTGSLGITTPLFTVRIEGRTEPFSTDWQTIKTFHESNKKTHTFLQADIPLFPEMRVAVTQVKSARVYVDLMVPYELREDGLPVVQVPVLVS